MLCGQKPGGVGWEKKMIHRNLGRDQNQSQEDHPSGPESAGILDREGDKRMQYGETRKEEEGPKCRVGVRT